MTAEEKARQLTACITTLIWETGNTVSKPMISKVACFCCDEVIFAIEPSDHEGNKLNFWNEVKTEINNL